MSKDTNKGQSKTFTITNPATGESREVNQRQWREEKLGQAGWQKPEDVDDDFEDDGEPVNLDEEGQ